MSELASAALRRTLPSGIALPPDPQVDLAALAVDRLTRLRTALAQSPLDVLVLTEVETVHYATGYRGMPAQVFRTHRVAAVLTETDLWLVCAAADGPAAAAGGVPVDRLVTFGRFFVEAAGAGSEPSNGAATGPVGDLTELSDRQPDRTQAVAQVLAALPSGTRVGVESAAAHPDLAGFATAPGAADADEATSVVQAARGVKLPTEVALLRYSAHLAEVSVAAALAVAGPGTTERELAAVVAATMAAGGGDPRFVVAATGPRSALADVVPSDRPWAPGETARFDVGCVVEGYWSDIGRTAVLGEPDARQRRVYDAVRAGEQDQLDAAGPGVRASELFAIGLHGTAAGVPRYRRQHCGHGIGLSIYEPPVIAPGVETALAPGMVFCFETPYYEIGWGGMMVEDTVVVTDTGVEVLSGTGRDLVVVPT